MQKNDNASKAASLATASSYRVKEYVRLRTILAILITVLSYNLLGEGIRDALDPRLRQARARRRAGR